MKTFISNLFFNLIRYKNFFLVNTFWLSIISLFLFIENSPAFNRTFIALFVNVVVYLFLFVQSKKYRLKKL